MTVWVDWEGGREGGREGGEGGEGGRGGGKEGEGGGERGREGGRVQGENGTCVFSIAHILVHSTRSAAGSPCPADTCPV